MVRKQQRRARCAHRLQPRAPGPAPAPALPSGHPRRSRPPPASTRGTTCPHPGCVPRGRAGPPHAQPAPELVHRASWRWGSQPPVPWAPHTRGVPKGSRPPWPGVRVSALWGSAQQPASPRSLPGLHPDEAPLSDTAGSVGECVSPLAPGGPPVHSLAHPRRVPKPPGQAAGARFHGGSRGMPPGTWLNLPKWLQGEVARE